MAAIGFQGTIVSVGETADPLTSVGCLVGYDRTGGGRSEIDATCSESVAKEFIFGLSDYGTLTVDVNYDPENAGWTIVEAAELSDTPYFFSIEFSNKPDSNPGATGTIKTFSGYVMSTSDNGALDDKLSGSFEVKISGAITQTAPVAGTP